jgi:hypothetical protein
LRPKHRLVDVAQQPAGALEERLPGEGAGNLDDLADRRDREPATEQVGN